MRMSLLFVALLAGCGYRVDDCKQPVRSFELDEDIDAQTVERMVLEHQVITHSDLECELVCESFYLDQNPRGGARGVDTCEMAFDDEFNFNDEDRDPEAIVGTITCSGRGVPQFCVDA